MTTKKCIVLDLDNTLWGGVVGEDGLEGIKLSLTSPGSAFIAFQQALLDLHGRGVILAINSRNNPDDALAVIRSHPNMILKENDFAAVRINWDDKVENIRQIAKELNIGLDSMVFLDDDPVNRASVRASLPEVEVPELPADPSEYVRFLMALPYFPSSATTDEDKMRGNLYVTERLRREAEKSYPTREAFLESMKLTLHLHINDASVVARLSQLTEKTNQFNTHKHPLNEAEVVALMENPGWTVLCGRATDRFGDHGITNLAIIEHQGDTWHIAQFLMSCRVIGRGIEEAFLAAIGRIAQAHHADRLSIAFVPTEKNTPAREFVEKYFTDGAGAISSIISPPPWIQII